MVGFKLLKPEDVELGDIYLGTDFQMMPYRVTEIGDGYFHSKPACFCRRGWYFCLRDSPDQYIKGIIIKQRKGKLELYVGKEFLRQLKELRRNRKT